MTLQSVIKMFTWLVYRTISVLWIMVKWFICVHLPLLLSPWMLSITLLLRFWPGIFITLIIASCISKILFGCDNYLFVFIYKALIGRLLSYITSSPCVPWTISDSVRWLDFTTSHQQHVPWVCDEPGCFYRRISHYKISSFKFCKNTVLLAILFYSYTRVDSDCRVCVVKQLVCRMWYNMLT